MYALHAMTGIFGPVKRVTCMCGQRYHDFEFDGKKIESEVDDSNQMILDFGDGFFGVAYSSLKNDFGNGFGGLPRRTPLAFAAAIPSACR